jgi:hypothetical protein
MKKKQLLYVLVIVGVLLSLTMGSGRLAAAPETDDSSLPIYVRPSVRFGTDDRTLYIMDILIPLYQGQKDVLFFNPRFTAQDIDGWETNVGLGYRHLFLNDRLMIGANVFYDTRETSWSTYHDQIGMGLEAMGEIPIGSLDLGVTGRFNYYIPLTDPITTNRSIGGGAGSGFVFREGGVYSIGSGTSVWAIEEALEGFDAEAGFRVPYLSNYVETWIYGGGYHYSGRFVKDIDGYSARLEVIPTDFLRFNYEYREDRTNKGEHYGEVTVEVPFSIENLVVGKNPFEGFGTRFGGSRSMHDRLMEPVRRNVDVVIEGEAGGGAVDDLVMEVVFVSDTAAPGAGDGTFENPYASIDEAMGNSRLIGGSAHTIHVMDHGGAGAYAGGGSVAMSDLFIWGSGVAYPSYNPISNFVYGMPYINSTLSLSGNNLSVRGLGFDVDGVAIDVLGGENIFLGDNDFGLSSIGVRLGGGTTTTIASTNTFGSGASRMVGTGILVDGGNGTIGSNVFYVTGTGIEFRSGSLLSVLGSTFDLGAPSDTGIVASGGTGGTFGGNTFSGTGTGIIFTGGSGTTVTGNVFGSELARLVGTGINIVAGTGTVHDTIDDNELYVDGIGVLISADEADLAVTNNTIVTDSYGVYANVPGSLGTPGTPITVSGNEITVDGTGGARDVAGIYLRSGGNIDAVITGNDMSDGVKGDLMAFGAYLRADTGTIDATVTDNNLVVESTGPNSDAAGIFALGDVVSGTYSVGTGSISVTAPRNAYGIIDAEIVDDLAELNTLIASDTSGWTYIRNGTYSGTINAVNRSLTLWGEGYDMYGMGSTGYPTFNQMLTLSAPNIEVMGLRFNITAPPSNVGINITNGTGVTIRNNIISLNRTSPYATAYGIYAGIVNGIGTEASPLVIRNNTISVVSNPDAYGISLFSERTSGSGENRIFAVIEDNTISVSGNSWMRGIYVKANYRTPQYMPPTTGTSYIGSATSPVVISGNTIVANSIYGNAYSISLEGATGIFADITDNNLSSTGGSSGNAYGIYLNNPITNVGSIGSEAVPVTISGNAITARAPAANYLIGNAYGINLTSQNNLFAEITGNNLAGGVGINALGGAVGIGLKSNYGSIGSSLAPVIVDNNILHVTMTGTDALYSISAYGINISGRTGLFAEVTNNDMSAGVSALRNAYGIYLTTTLGDIGSRTLPVLVSGNNLNVLSRSTLSYYSGYGIYEQSQADLFSHITDNTIAVKGYTAYGAYLRTSTSTGTIGDFASSPQAPVLFTGNSGTVDGTNATNARYLLYLYSTGAAGGNYVDLGSWSSNVFTPYRNGVVSTWNGNYGPSSQVYENFAGPPWTTNMINP